MTGVLLHVYRKGYRPFRTLSALPDEEALYVMSTLYVEGSVFWKRFGQPVEYLRFRRQVEQDLRDAFISKGGNPRDTFPVYFMLGRPKWMDAAADPLTLETTELIEVPLSVVAPDEISFTYPDSMLSARAAAEKDPAYFDPACHGKLFTLDEITEFVDQEGLPGEQWQTPPSNDPPIYVEAQVWNHRVLDAYLCDMSDEIEPV